MSQQPQWPRDPPRWYNIFDYLATINAKLNYLKWLQESEFQMTQSEFDAITAKITEEDTVIGSAVTLLDELTALIKANQNDPALLQQVIAKIEAEKTTLANAVQANTPSA